MDSCDVRRKVKSSKKRRRGLSSYIAAMNSNCADRECMAIPSSCEFRTPASTYRERGRASRDSWLKSLAFPRKLATAWSDGNGSVRYERTCTGIGASLHAPQYVVIRYRCFTPHCLPGQLAGLASLRVSSCGGLGRSRPLAGASDRTAGRGTGCPAIEAESEFIQVVVQMLFLDGALVSSQQPSLDLEQRTPQSIDDQYGAKL